MKKEHRDSTARTNNRFTRRTLLRTVGASGLASGLFSQSLSATQTPAKQEEFPPEKRTEWGEKAELGNGEIRTFVTFTKNDRPKFVGVWFSAETLQGLPSEHTEDLLDIPATDRTPFTFHQVNWNPHGHAPDGIYSIPHFDFHFHLTPESLLEEIDAGSCERDGMTAHVTCETYERGTEPLPPEQMPPGYVDSGDVIPGMGNHLINPNALEFQNVRFRHTFVYGAFDGRLTFFEPMITKNFLRQRNEEVRTSISMPDTFPKPGWYPTEYSIRYLSGENAYAITLETFKQFDS